MRRVEAKNRVPQKTSKSEEIMNQRRSLRSALQSAGAVLVGLLVGGILSVGTDQVLHVLKVYPPWGQRTPSGPLLLATAYRIVYTILGAYVTARLAPDRPMKHVLALGIIGVILSIAGALATWNLDLGPHWYPIAIIVMALPCTWLGGQLFMRGRGLPVS
jgi:hypothetical protein